MSISNSSSLTTTTLLRCSVLKMMPELDKGFVDITFKSVEKGCSQRPGDLVCEYFVKAAPAVIDFLLYRKSDVLKNGGTNYLPMIEKLLAASKKSTSTTTTAAHIKRSIQGLLTIKHLIDISSTTPVKDNCEVENCEAGHPSLIGKLITHPTDETLDKFAHSVQNSKPLSVVEGKKLLSLTTKLLAPNDIEKLSVIARVRFPSSSTKYSKVASQVLALFSTWLKKQVADPSTLPYTSIRNLYLHLAPYFLKFDCKVELKYISDSLLNLSSKCKASEQTAKYYADLLHDSLSVELSILELSTLQPTNLLVPKLERVVVGYLSSEKYCQAMTIIVKTLNVLFINSSVNPTMPIAEISKGDSIEQCITFISRICLKRSTAIDLLESISISSIHKSIILELLLWHLIGVTNGCKKKLVEDIMSRLYCPSAPLNHQLRYNIAYFLATGSLYTQMDQDLSCLLLQFTASTSDPETLYIKSMAEFILAITYKSGKQKVSYICDAVFQMSEFLSIVQYPTLYKHEVETLSSYLELHTFHDLRVHLLSAYVNSLQNREVSDEETDLHGAYLLDIARSYHHLGYSGAVGRQLSKAQKILNSSQSPLQYGFLLVLEAEYFTSVDRKDDAAKSLSKLQSHIENSQALKEPLSAGRDSGESSQHFQQRIVLYCRATQAFVNLWVLNGVKELAIVAMMNLTRLLPGLLKRDGYNVWCLSTLLMDAHFRIAKIYEEVGIVKEAQYHIHEAIKLAESTECLLGLSQLLTFQAELLVRMGKSEDAQNLLHRCEEIFDDDKQFVPLAKKGIEFLNIIYSTAFYLQRQSLFNEEQIYYDMGESFYSQLEFPDEKAVIDSISRKVSELNLSESPSVRPSERAVGLEAVRNKLIRSHVHSLGDQGLVEHATEILKAAHMSPQKFVTTGQATREDILFKISESRNCYLKARKLLMQDPVYGVLQDSVISVPSVNNEDGSRKTSLSNLPTNPQCAEAVKHLIQAKSKLLESVGRAHHVCTNIERVDMSNLLNTISILLSAVCNAQERSLYTYFSYLEQTKASSTLSETQISILQERYAGNYLQWPKYDHKDMMAKCTNVDQVATGLFTAVSDFDNSRLLQALPDDWLVVSLNIASSGGNLIVSRYEKERDPFMITLPLNRHSSRDIDEPSFSFNDGLQKLKDIIDRSNASADISRTSQIHTPDEKRAWWNERFALDKDLETLLRDAEYCWLGGFRGIFDSQVPSTKLADKFANDFRRILDRYLPSRGTVMRSRRGLKGADKVTGKGMMQKPVKINSRVFELFLGLGHPDTLEDPGLLEDLVYFVLDIIQFHGEQNAYDELDIDQLVVDVEESLRSYHVRAQNIHSKKHNHIILVVDKKCQQFPWESIPLLRNRSVTRVPSLSILNRLLLARNNPTFSPPGHDVYYVLNPSKDLVRTQERFETSFTSMRDWQGVICQAPSEEEFADALSNKDLFIYIGHGGGEKYIRSAKLKSLKKCSPTLLFGCSSGFVQEAGEYDPIGTAMNFIASGCPMLVANMWDVTDKDIDTFSQSMLERWGVLETSEPGTRFHIGEAVSMSRDNCTLKYLTGAAPVIYGLPLESAIVL